MLRKFLTGSKTPKLTQISHSNQLESFCKISRKYNISKGPANLKSHRRFYVFQNATVYGLWVRYQLQSFLKSNYKIKIIGALKNNILFHSGVPAVVDLAAMRDAMQRLGGDPSKINPLCPVDLVIDHSVQADVFGTKDAAKQNEIIEFNRNFERFQFLKWGSKAFDNFKIVPPGSGIVHQVNLEYLARVVMERDGLLYNDSVVGTDSHTTMINGLGVAGWGVGGIEAESVMLG